MYIVGLTGGIGTGKTTVSEIFKKLGIPVYNSDIEAKKLMHTDKELIKKISNLFGKDIYKDNLLDRKKLAAEVFSNKEKLNRLNAIVHPAVKQDFELWALRQNSLYQIKESAILFESGIYKNVDKIITVTAPLNLRIKRLIKRDNTSQEEIKKRINNQLDEKFKTDNSDFIIDNNTSKLLIPQVLLIHNNLSRSIKNIPK